MPRNVSRYPCSGCHLEVRPRQEAISCDRCHRWRHRLCNTGMNRPEYREMTKKIKEGVEVSWICPDCRIRNFTSDFLDMEPSIAEQPIADHEEPIADQHADHEEPIADQEEPIADQHTDREEPITDQPDMDFDVNRTIDDSVHPMEPSLQEEQITDADIPEDRPVQYTIVSTGTQRERSRLHDSLGYMYTVKRKTPRGAYWWCSVRGKTVRCPARCACGWSTAFSICQRRSAPVTRGCPHVVCGRHIQGCQGPVLSALVSACFSAGRRSY